MEFQRICKKSIIEVILRDLDQKVIDHIMIGDLEDLVKEAQEDIENLLVVGNVIEIVQEELRNVEDHVVDINSNR